MIDPKKETALTWISGRSSDLRSHCAAPCTSKYVRASDVNSPDAVASLARPLSCLVIFDVQLCTDCFLF